MDKRLPEDAKLKTSIIGNGVKQNFTGYGYGRNGYLIDAGGRRLKLARVAPCPSSVFGQRLTRRLMGLLDKLDDH